MSPAPVALDRPQKDPLLACAGVAIAFLVLLWLRLHIPTRIYFDEVHYVKAARELLLMARPINAEHPMVGKEFLALAIRLFGDTPQSWRIFPALFGTLGLFAFSRALWLASGRTFATLAGTILLASNFLWFVMSRIAMLDMFMASFAMLAMWMLAGAVRLPAQGRWRLILAGLFLGLSLGSKWNVLAAAMVPGLAFLVLRLRRHGRAALLATGGAPVPGISLAEAALWLGTLPLLVYFVTFLPTFFYAAHPVRPLHLVEYQGYMLKLQHSVVKHHPYQSVWWQWIFDIRAIWFLYDNIDGAQRGVVLLGNPFTLLAGLPALAWCLWTGLHRNLAQRRPEALAAAIFYLVSIGMWVANGKPVQFFYHYLLPASFLMACLALALDALWRRSDRWRWVAPGSVALSLALFAWFFPILSAAKLCCGRPSFEWWMWLPTWR